MSQTNPLILICYLRKPIGIHALVRLKNNFRPRSSVYEQRKAFNLDKRNTQPPSNLAAWQLRSEGFCKLHLTKQTYFYLLKMKKKERKRKKAMHRQKPTVAGTPGHNDNVMTSPAAVPRILRENQKIK